MKLLDNDKMKAILLLRLRIKECNGVRTDKSVLGELISQCWRVGQASPKENRNRLSCGTVLALITSHLISPLHAIAQISTDGSLATTINSADGINFAVENVTRSGRNLFRGTPVWLPLDIGCYPSEFTIN